VSNGLGSARAWRHAARHGVERPRRSGERGFTQPRRSAEHGFTLVELLVAVMIFAMLSITGVALLRSSVDGQAAIAVRLDALADVQRGLATLDGDLSQAVVRITRTREGTLAPAFFGRSAQDSEPLMQFVRDGWSNPAMQRRPNLQKVEYWWREGRIERVGHAALDGAEAPEPAVLFERVTGLGLRYRAKDGAWLERWAPERPDAMPTAVELRLERAGEAPLTLRFLVGTAIHQPDREPKPGEADNAA
jgi:general secretion pathway protein J